MEQTITREFWIPKTVTVFGMFAGAVNIFASSFFCDLRFTAFHLTVSLIYMALAIATTLYSIHERLKFIADDGGGPLVGGAPADAARFAWKHGPFGVA